MLTQTQQDWGRSEEQKHQIGRCELLRKSQKSPSWPTSIFMVKQNTFVCLSLDFCPITLRRELHTNSLRSLWGMWRHRLTLKGPLALLLWSPSCSRKGGQRERWIKWVIGQVSSQIPPEDLRTGKMPGVQRKMNVLVFERNKDEWLGEKTDSRNWWDWYQALIKF